MRRVLSTPQLTDTAEVESGANDPFSTVIGNKPVSNALRTAIAGARAEARTLGHILFTGPSGVGKTHFAKMVAESVGATMTRIHGPSITRRNVNDIMRALLTLSDRDVLFVDEIHALPLEGMECLYQAMEESQVSIPTPEPIDPTAGSGPAFITVSLSAFTLIGATTKPGSLSEPLRTRFTRTLQLQPYTHEELALILGEDERGASMLDASERMAIASRSRGRARRALHLMSVCLDHRLIGHTIDDAFREMGVGVHGDLPDDRVYVNALRGALRGGPSGLDAIVAVTGLDKLQVELDIEPFLISLGVIQRTPRGRILSGDLT